VSSRWSVVAERARAFRLVGRALGALLSASLLLLAAYEWHTFRSINDHVTRFELSNVGKEPTDAALPGADTKDLNILLVGNDDRTNMTDAEVRELKVGRDGGSLNTDTMMVVHVPADGSKATLISLPRDSYVAIPGYGKNKLNAAYAFGYTHASGSTDAKRAAGADLLVETVSNLTGLKIDHYIQVSLMGFYDIADAIGGVPVNLCESVDDTHAYNVSQGGSGGSGFKMSAGKHTLNGLQALEFVRQRYNFPNGLGDLDRVKRQQYFLTAAFRRVASINFLFKLAKLGDALERNVFLDGDLDLLELAHQMEDLSANNIVGRTIPFDRFQDVDINGLTQNVEIVNPADVRAHIKRWIEGAPASGKHHHHHAGDQRALDAKCIY
jgi:LCP family protein required for cell wall assembly